MTTAAWIQEIAIILTTLWYQHSIAQARREIRTMKEQ